MLRLLALVACASPLHAAAAAPCGATLAAPAVLDADLVCSTPVGVTGVGGLDCRGHSITFAPLADVKATNQTAVVALGDGSDLTVRNCVLKGWPYAVGGGVNAVENVTIEDVGSLVNGGGAILRNVANITATRSAVVLSGNNVVVSGVALFDNSTLSTSIEYPYVSNVVAHNSRVDLGYAYTSLAGAVGVNSTLSVGGWGADSMSNVMWTGGSVAFSNPGGPGAGYAGILDITGIDANISVYTYNRPAGQLRNVSAARCAGSPVPVLDIISDIATLSDVAVHGAAGRYAFAGSRYFNAATLQRVGVFPAKACGRVAWRHAHSGRTLPLPHELPFAFPVAVAAEHPMRRHAPRTRVGDSRQTGPAPAPRAAALDAPPAYGWTLSAAPGAALTVANMTCSGPSVACFRVADATTNVTATNVAVVANPPFYACSVPKGAANVNATYPDGRPAVCVEEN